MQKLVQRLGFNTENSFFRGNHAFVHQIAGNLQSGGCRSLSVSGLQEVKLSFFNGKLHVLHIPVVVFQLIGYFNKFFIAFGQILFQTGNRLGSPDSGHNIFALRVDEVFSVNSPGPCGRIPGKCNTGTGSIAHISEYHGLYVNCCSPVAGDIVHSAVYDGTFVIPGAEHSLYGLHQLDLGILREILAHLVLVDRFEASDDFLQIISGQIRIIMSALGFFNLVKNPLKQ